MPGPRIIAAGRFNDLARSLFNISQDEQLLLADEIRPEVVLESDRPEWGLIKGERLWSSLLTTAPQGVGLLSYSGVRVPITAQGFTVIEYIESFEIAAAGTSDIVVGWQSTSLPGQTALAPIQGTRDSRAIFRGGGAVLFNHMTNLVTGDIAGGVLNGAVGAIIASLPTKEVGLRVNTDPDFRVILGPGGFCVLQASIANQTVNGTMRGYERNVARSNRLD